MNNQNTNQSEAIQQVQHPLRKAWNIIATAAIFLLLLSALIIGTGEMLQGQMLRMGERMFGDPDNGVQYSFLRADPETPTCERNPNIDQLVDEKYQIEKADPMNELIGLEPDKGQIRESIIAAQQICEEKYQTYDKLSGYITPSVRAYRKAETGLLFITRFGVDYRPILLVLIVAIAAITTTLGLHHIAIRPPSTKRDFAVYSWNMVAANVLLFICSGYYFSTLVISNLGIAEQAHAFFQSFGLDLFFANLKVAKEKLLFHGIWVLLFLVLSIISIYRLIKRPKVSEQGSWLLAGLSVPLYASMAIITSVSFLLFMQYPSGISIYLGQMEELSGVFVNLALFIWIGMLLKQTHLVDYFLDVLRPFNFAPETLTWFLMVGAAILTAYTGASGIFVIAAGAIIYKEVLLSGARRQYALAVTAMSGSLGVVLRPCLLIVVIAALNNQVTTDKLYYAGKYVFWLSSSLLFLASIALAKEKFRLRSPALALPESAKALVPVSPYIVIFVLIAWGLYGWGLETSLNEFTAAVILPVIMLAILGFDKIRTHKVSDDYLVIADNDRLAEQQGHTTAVYAKPEQLQQNKGVGFLGAISLATSETIGHIGALIMLMALSVSVGGLIERSEIMMAVPADLGGTLIALSLFTVMLVLIGMVMDPFGAAILVNATIAPIAYKNGIDPVHFWIVVLTAFELGYLTPPVALNQLLARQVVGEKEMADADAEVSHKSFYWRYERWVLPFSIMLVTLLCVSFLPYFFGWFDTYK